MTDDDRKKREELLNKMESWIRCIIVSFELDDDTSILDLAKARKELIDYIDNWIKE